MTEQELAAVVDGIVPVIRECVSSAVSEHVTRIAVLESQLKAAIDLRDRLVAVETKAASAVAPSPVTFDAAPLLARLSELHSELRSAKEQIAALEAKSADLPDRLLTVEHRTPTKELWTALTENVTDLRSRLVALEPLTKDIGSLRERVAVVEVRPLLPGPAGIDGKDGKDGTNGLNGKDGADGLGFDDVMVEHDGERTFTVKYARGERVKVAGSFTVPMEIYRGVYIDGKSYERGDGVTWGGSEWHCNEPTTSKPGDGSKAWTLKVKRGRDGRDGKDAGTLPVVKA